jgi:hypothetical protein
MTGQSIGVRVGVWIGQMLLQALITYLIARFMHQQTVGKVITLMEGVEQYVKVSR